MKQQFLELIDRKIEAYNNGDSLSGYEKLLQELRQEVEKIEERDESQWISVIYRPEPHNYIVTNGKSSFEAQWSNASNCFMHIDDSGKCEGITHYMPLPNPPTI